MKEHNLTMNFRLSEANGQSKKFRGVANSGEPFFDGFGLYCIDFADFKQEGEIVPVLLEHDRAKRIGFGSLSVIHNALEIEGEFLDNAEANQVITDAKQGFPWQLSVHIVAKEEIRLAKNQKATVNDKEVKGETGILKDFLIREVSFTPTGVDEKTTAQVLSLRNRKLKMENEEQKAPSAEDWAEKEQGYLDEIAELKKQIESLKEQNENLQALVGDLELEDKLKEEGIESSQLSASAKSFLKSADKKVRDEFLSLVRSQRSEKKETAPDALFAETAASPKSKEQKLALAQYVEEKKKQTQGYI